MKRLMQIAVAAAIVALAVSPAWAQQQRQRGGGFGGFGGDPIYLLGQKSVQEELKLTDEQIKKAKELSDKRSEAFQGLRDLSREEQQKKRQEIAKANNKALAEILKPEQLKRVKQIALQQRITFGLAFVVSDEETASALRITDEQKEKIREIRMKGFEELRALGQERDEETNKKRQELMKATNEKVAGVLTAEQKTKLKEMQGAPFTGKIERPQFPGRRNR
jgi:Spy/CpxP family protein refolding chaperone